MREITDVVTCEIRERPTRPASKTAVSDILKAGTDELTAQCWMLIGISVNATNQNTIQRLTGPKACVCEFMSLRMPMDTRDSPKATTSITTYTQYYYTKAWQYRTTYQWCNDQTIPFAYCENDFWVKPLAMGLDGLTNPYRVP